MALAVVKLKTLDYFFFFFLDYFNLSGFFKAMDLRGRISEKRDTVRAKFFSYGTLLKTKSSM